MNRRLLLGGAMLALLAVTAGCLGGGSVSDESLDAEPRASYDWNETETVHISIQDNARFRAVYELNQSEIELFRRDGFGGRNPISVEAVRYRYPNGTVVSGSAFDERGGGVTRTRDVTRVTLPSDASAGGKLAFTAGSTPKRFSLPVFVEGSYEVVLPEDRRVDFFLFGSVSPGGSERTRDDAGRTHLAWENVTSRSVVVQFYLQRDLYIFGGIAAVLLVVGAVGSLYYRRQIEELRQKRREVGPDDIDVDVDDDREGPPPGMR